MQMQRLALFLLASSTLAAAHDGSLRGAMLHGGSSAPSSAPASAPSAPLPSLNTLEVAWEIKNLNYYDLTKPWTPGKDVRAVGKDWTDETAVERFADGLKNEKKKKSGKAGINPLKDLHKGVGKVTDHIDKHADKAQEGADKALDGPDDKALDGLMKADKALAKSNAVSDDTKANQGSALPWPTKGQGDAPASPKSKDDAAPPKSKAMLQGKGNGKKAPEGSGLPWPTKAVQFGLYHRKNALLLDRKSKQTSGVTTIQKVLRRSIEDSIKEMFCTQTSSGPGPAPAPAPGPVLLPTPNGAIPPPVNAALLSVPAPMPAAAPSPMPMPEPECQTPKVHVIFSPGSEMKQRNVMTNKPPVEFPPKTTKVTVSIFDRPKNDENDLQKAAVVFKKALATGDLIEEMAEAVGKVTGIAPKFTGLKVKPATVKAWDIEKCENRMSKIIKTFTVHYTKRQVPMALYNECTNFVTKISFSHDHVLDHRDEVRCREATASFAKRWKLGKNDNPKDFNKMCVGFCEAKYGNDAPMCHLTGGDELASQPL